MSKFHCALLAAATALSSPAFAADLPTDKGPPLAPAPPAFTWTGFYVGAQAGYGWGPEDDNLTEAIGGAPVPITFDTFHTSGALGGVHIGYNYQISTFVFGAEGEFDAAGIHGGKSGTNPQVEGVTVTTLSLQNHVQGSIRGRVGFAFDRFLVYGTGGLALADVTETATFTSTSTDSFYDYSGFGSQTKTLVGWTAGGGIAYAIDNNWSVNAEARYTDFGSQPYTITFSYPPPNQFTYHAKFDETTVTAGISYKFWTGP